MTDIVGQSTSVGSFADGQLYSVYPVRAYLAYRLLKDNARQLAEQQGGGGGRRRNSSQQPPPEQFFLKHVGNNGQHLLVDDNFNITVIMDWQHARVVPRREAFGASLVTIEMEQLCRAGKLTLSARDKVPAESAARQSWHG
jgi:hypothetical protein